MSGLPHSKWPSCSHTSSSVSECSNSSRVRLLAIDLRSTDERPPVATLQNILYACVTRRSASGNTLLSS